MRALPNTVLTPHLGFITHRCFRVSYEQVLEDVRAFLAGAPIRVVPARNFYPKATAQDDALLFKWWWQ